MRLVAVADTHTFERDLGDIPAGDVFIHAGDLLRHGSIEELVGVAEWLRSLPHPYKVVVAGNHDWCFIDQRKEAEHLLGDGVLYLQDSEVTIGGLRFWGSPWQPEYNKWAFNLRRGPELRAKWELIPDGIDVLITHGPPNGIGDRSPSGGRAGCEELLAAMLRVGPSLHLFGHIHQDGGLWYQGQTALANVTTSESERAPTVLDVDPATKTVSVVSVPPPR